MEINKYTDIEGVVAQEAIPEGRMVLLTQNVQSSVNFGSRTDLPGVRLPDNATESARARFVVAFSLDNRPTPFYQPIPQSTYAFRQGYSVTANVPFTAEVFLAHPGNMVGQTIPSGSLALAFDRGVFSVPSGAYIYNANLQIPGTFLTVANAADDGAAHAGKWKYSATASLGVVQAYDSTTGDLTFRTL